MRRALATALLTAIAAIGLTACGTDDVPKTTVTTTEPVEEGSADGTNGTPAIADPATEQRNITELAVRMTWDATPDTQREVMCSGIDMFGHDWAVENLRDGAGTDTELDWDYAAELIQTECDKR